jgi:hypothetical protein
VAGTLLGDFRVRQQKAACEGWPTRDLGAEIQQPVVSDVPALLISGERDPVTPPANGEKVVRTLKNGLHLIVPDAGHSTEGMHGNDCLNGVIDTFIASGTTQGLDTSCVARMRRPDFVLNWGGPEVKLTQADLERLTGTYADPAAGRVAKADVVNHRLRITLDGTPVLLVATAPNRFRIEGFSPQLVATFQMAGERAASMTLGEPGTPDQVLQRRRE